MIFIGRIKNKCYCKLQGLFKKLKNRSDKKRLRNNDFTIITNHCMGGFIYHDLGLCFLSPTINLKITPADFVEFAKNLKYYLSQEIEIHQNETLPYPIGKIKRINGYGYIYLYFVHYKTFEEAVNKWNQRKSRVNWDNIFIMMTARDGCDEDILKEFEALNYSHKVCFTLKPHPELPHCKYTRLDNQSTHSGYISDMINIFGKRAFECNNFDYIDYLNKEENISYD